MSLELKGRAETLQLPKVKEEECGSEPLLTVKKEDHIGPKQWIETLVEIDSGSLEVKEEPVELQLQQIKKEDHQSASEQMVKIETESIIQVENQNELKQESDTLMGTECGSVRIKEEAALLELKQIKEDDYHPDSQQMIKIEDISQDEIKEFEPKQVKEEEGESDFLQKVKTEANDTSQNENQNPLMMATDNETEHQQPERNGNQFSKNIPKAEHHQDRKTLEASGSSRDERHQQRVVKTRGRGNTGTKDKEINRSKICKLCSTSFKWNQSLEAHMRTHTDEKPFSCVTCGKSFFSKNSFSCHKRTHSVQKLFSCTMCSKGFHLKGNLKSHMRTHTGEKPFSCGICMKSFSQKCNLNTHMKIHTGEKLFTPFSCRMCKKSFHLRCSLKNHMRTHTGEKPFSCEMCRKSFSQKSNLKSHMRTHTGEKPFSCGKCRKSFSRKHTLHRHMNTHTGEKPFSCGKCRKGFSLKHTLHRHENSVQNHF
ncbi:zinc finger protein OZF-like isoform X1 [Poecilia formosa]|uniref:zinc finger protein OZF-like isoform X1 n=1 Tax=Poecilia formosa TaxID=48698 RepID=UPI000443D329|nr:PREDICTED: zinc finger protein OZF-like isoform X1 [Poecilia formosa]